MSNSERKTGCELWEDCLTCPYPDDCVVGAGAKTEVTLKKGEAIRLSRKGHSAEEIAREIGRSVRQVNMYLKIGKT